MNNPLAFNHNRYYHPFVLRRLPARMERALDMGCGAGEFAVKLAARAGRVDAVDRSAEMIRQARKRVPGNVRCVEADLLAAPLEPAAYDAVTSITALHHMPLEEALAVVARVLRPGGTFVAVGLPRYAVPSDLPRLAWATVAHTTYGAGLAARRLVTRRPASLEWTDHNGMPIVDPELTIRQVRARAGAVLPGARVRHLTYFRYALLWRRPT